MDFNRDVIRPALQDIRVELEDEFDRNFERKAFFDEAWDQVKADPGIGSLMNRTGTLRRSMDARLEGDSIIFSSSMPYAQIHNEGGQVTTRIPVTDKMRRWAWYMHKLTGDDKYKGMALTKKTEFTATFHMPKRQFIGHHPQIDEAVTDIIDGYMRPFMDNIFRNV